MDNLTRLFGQSNPLGKLNLLTMPLCLYEGNPAAPGDPNPAPAPAPEPTPTPAPAFSWKNNINADLRNSPTLQKFDDTAEGLGKAIESHLSLEKLLGHEKIPLPKDANDKEGWDRFNKAMGVPDKAEGYGLKDVTIPESIKNIGFDKKAFAEVLHELKVPPQYANSLWEKYTQVGMTAYNKAVKAQTDKLMEIANTLRQEWGDSYEANVDLGQMVINKFSDDKETNDFLTASFLKDPIGIKFLAKIGQQFAENKIGEFQAQRFTLTPEQAQGEIDKILKDPTHPYTNEKATKAEHDKAVSYVNSLYAVIAKAKG